MKKLYCIDLEYVIKGNGFSFFTKNKEKNVLREKYDLFLISSKDTIKADLKKYLLECLKTGFNDNIIITGGVGIGKTHLAYAIVNALENVVYLPNKEKIYTCDKVVLVSASDLLKNIRKLWDKEKDEVDFRTVEEYKKIPLLIID